MLTPDCGSEFSGDSYAASRESCTLAGGRRGTWVHIVG
jgi:hypothetical protein